MNKVISRQKRSTVGTLHILTVCWKTTKYSKCVVNKRNSSILMRSVSENFLTISNINGWQYRTGHFLPEITKLRWLELQITGIHFDSPIEFEPSTVYMFLKFLYKYLHPLLLSSSHFLLHISWKFIVNLTQWKFSVSQFRLYIWEFKGE